MEVANPKDFICDNVQKIGSIFYFPFNNPVHVVGSFFQPVFDYSIIYHSWENHTQKIPLDYYISPTPQVHVSTPIKVFGSLIN